MAERVGILGCGHMGQVYARAWRETGRVAAEDLVLVDRVAERRAELRADGFGTVLEAPDEALRGCAVVVLAIKPQDFAALAPDLAPLLHPDAVLLSIMAGVPVARIRAATGHEQVVRAMPNLPARIGMGMTAFTAPEGVDRRHLRLAEALLDATGRAVFVEQEELLDAVTAISGSGPAYVFLLVAEMVRSAVAMGLDEPTARLLVRQTLLGSAHLLQQGDRSPDEWIASVSSRGGTTEAAFAAFRERGLADALREGMLRARDRARALSGEA